MQKQCIQYEASFEKRVYMYFVILQSKKERNNRVIVMKGALSWESGHLCSYVA